MTLHRWSRALSHAAAGALLLLACGLVAACGSSNNNGAKGTPAPKTTPSAGTSSRIFAKAPAFTIDTNKGYVATIKTDKGDIVVQLNAKVAPLTVNNFVFLAQQHFYDGLTCHRVIQDYIAQCGDPKGDGSGGPGYTIPDEKSPLLHLPGAIAMAKGDAPNTAGSQFYIVTAQQDLTNLDGNYTVFGQVIQGLDVARSLTPRDPQTATQPGDRISSITIQVTDTTPTPVASAVATPGAAGTPNR